MFFLLLFMFLSSDCFSASSSCRISQDFGNGDDVWEVLGRVALPAAFLLMGAFIRKVSPVGKQWDRILWVCFCVAFIVVSVPECLYFPVLLVWL